MENRKIYLDHAATTAVDPRVLNKMLPYFTEVYGNANSQHFYGRASAKAVDEARDTIADCIGAKPSEIYITSGGTEADNWVLRGVCSMHDGGHVIVSSIEHAAMLSTAKELEKKGYEFTYLPVDEYGMVNPEDVKKAIRPDTILVAVMYANNEVGTIQPIEEIVQICKERKVPVFTDAVQAMGVIDIDVSRLGVDMMSFSAHKFGGPKGIGALYIRTGVRIDRLISGGHQERTRRGGTTNVAGMVGFAEALKIAKAERTENVKKTTALRDHFISRVLAEIPDVKLNGHPTQRLCGNADFSFRYIEGESILFRLDFAGIAVSSGSACSSGSLDPSHVLLAMGLPEELAHGSIRFSFGAENTMEEVDYVVDSLKEIISSLRAMSPLFHA